MPVVIFYESKSKLSLITKAWREKGVEPLLVLGP
jgi:hypothetical protein